MNYYIDLFSPETARAYEKSKRNISGFRVSRKTYVENKDIGPGDRLICYVTKLMRFVGILEIKSKYFIDIAPIFKNKNDPFILRFNVDPLVNTYSGFYHLRQNFTAYSSQVARLF